MKQLGEKLHIMRTIHGLTQKDVADHLHVKRSTYAYYELGRIEPSLDTAVAISDFFEISLDNLLRQWSSLQVFQSLYRKNLLRLYRRI